MKFVKYTIIGALIGLSLGGFLSIGVVGTHSKCEGAKGCLGCFKLGSDGCVDCLSGCITPVKPFLYGCAGCFGFSCSNACIDSWYWDCSDCSNDCMEGCEDGFKECNKGCGDCGTSKCGQGCEECATGCDNDCDYTQEQLSSDPYAKKKIKCYLTYLTIIGTAIGAVYGIVCDIQEKREKRRKAEEAERKRKQKIEEDKRKRQQEAEERERRRKQLAEEKWQEMQAWLSE